MSPKEAFLLYSSQFHHPSAYEGELSNARLVNEAASALTTAERELAASYLEGELRKGNESLASIWRAAEGQLGLKSGHQYDFTGLSISALRNPRLRYRPEVRGTVTHAD